MSKRRASKRAAAGKTSNSKLSVTFKAKGVIAIGLLLSLVATAGVLARRGSLLSVREPAPANTTRAVAQSGTPVWSKDYVYGPGGKIIATEEPVSTCTFSLSQTSASFSSAAGTGSFTVTTGAGCNWTVVSNDSWITISGGAAGSGTGTVNYSITQNVASTQRTGTMTVAGQTLYGHAVRS